MSHFFYFDPYKWIMSQLPYHMPALSISTHRQVVQDVLYNNSCFHSVAKSHLTLCDLTDCARQVSLSFTISRSLFKLMPIESVMFIKCSWPIIILWLLSLLQLGSKAKIPVKSKITKVILSRPMSRTHYFTELFNK